MSDQPLTTIVTGSSSGIGLDIAKACLNSGGNVVINGRDPARLAAVAADLGTAQRLASVAGDIGERETGEALAHTAVERFGRVDVLVKVLDKSPATTFVVIDEVELEDWGIGGMPVEAWRKHTK